MDRHRCTRLRFVRCLQSRLVLCCLVSAVGAFLQGCTATSNPVANGIPVRKVPPELLAESKAGSQALPLSVLRQKQPTAHLIGPEDVLGIWIEGVLGEKGQAPPLRVSDRDQPPSLGYPIPVRSDGTISLPFVDAVKVQGMTLEQAQEAVRKAYTVTKQIIQPGQERILVTLQHPRQYHVLVIRQDASPNQGTGAGNAGGGGGGGRAIVTQPISFIIGGGGGGEGTRRGTGFAIDLPAYKNDVLNALAQTGGLPGTDAVNEIIIERGGLKGGKGRDDLVTILQNLSDPSRGDTLPLVAPGTQRIRIPLRLRPGEQFAIRPEDVVLHDGDIVLIQARELDVFYTGGLLPAGEYVLPRDTDLDVLQAITRIGGSILSGGLSTANISGTLTTNPGIGYPSPSLASVIRRTPDGGQVTIRVDLNRAMRDPRERILIQPRDLIILQERPEEGIARFVGQQLQFNFISNLFSTSASLGTVSAKVP